MKALISFPVFLWVNVTDVFFKFFKLQKKFILTFFGLVLIFTVWATPTDEDRFGKSQGYPVGTRLNWTETQFKVGSFSNYDQLHWVGTVKRGDRTSPIIDRIDSSFDWTYKTTDGSYSNTRDYLDKNQITGFLVLRDNVIVREDYQYGRKLTDRFMSGSMAKTLVALTVGIALSEGKISSIEDKVEKYLPETLGTIYGTRTIRTLLQMSSGLHSTDTPQNAGGWIRLGGDQLPSSSPRGPAGLSNHQQFKSEKFQVDTKFVYHGADTDMLGYLVAGAVGKPLNEYFSEKIWIPLGAEDDAYWSVDMGRNVVGASGFTARLRDYARLGGMLANNGKWDGRQIVPEKWIVEMTTPNKQFQHTMPGVNGYLGYGYQTWLFPEQRRFALLGIYGQGIFVDPNSKTVLLLTGVWDEPVDTKRKGPDRVSFWIGLINKVSRW